MNKISSISDYAKENNIKFGVIVFVSLTFFIYSIISIIFRYTGYLGFLRGYFTFADYQFLIGAVGGVLCTMKYRKEEQSVTKANIIVIVVGGLISALSITIVDAILYTLTIEFFFYYFIERSLFGLIIGFLVGMILGARYLYKDLKEDEKKESEEDRYGDDFFEDLIDK